MVDFGFAPAHIWYLEKAMTENVKLPRKLSEEREPPPPKRPSHADVIENLDRWANSPELQPPGRVNGRTPDKSDNLHRSR
jgi:hypothetical protein